MRHLVFCIILLGWGGFSAYSQQPLHPRGLVTAAELPAIRERLNRHPYSAFFQKLLADIADASNRMDLAYTDQNIFASKCAFAYLLTDDRQYANMAWKAIRPTLNAPEFTDPFSRGLDRATMLREAATVYDFCYPAWTAAQRLEASAALLASMVSLSANMGWEGNYSISSNWMGVRYGAVVYAACVWDETDPAYPKSRALSLLWDNQKRLQDHLDAVMFSNGWNGESMGYHVYDWSFVAPALIGLQNQSRSSVFLLQHFSPKLLNAMHALSTAAVDIRRTGARGMKPDLSDDNLNAFGADALALAFRLYPPAQMASLRWVFDYRFGSLLGQDIRYPLLFYPDHTPARNPAKAGWLHYQDPEQGIALFRNRFQDSLDIVLAVSATARRVQGHQGPDTDTWRLLGLGAPWIIGGGRTDETQVQTNLFPAPEETPEKGTKETGCLLGYGFRPLGALPSLQVVVWACWAIRAASR